MNYKLAFCTFLLLASCAPKVQDRVFQAPKLSFGPRVKDTDLRDGLRQSDKLKVNLSWQDTVATAEYLQQAENMMVIGNRTSSAEITQRGVSWVQKFYATPNATSMTGFAETPFVIAAAAETKREVDKTLAEIGDELDRSLVVLKSGIRRIGKNFAWPKKRQRLADALQTAENFLNKFLAEIPKMGLPDIVSENPSTDPAA